MDRITAVNAEGSTGGMAGGVSTPHDAKRMSFSDLIDLILADEEERAARTKAGELAVC